VSERREYSDATKAAALTALLTGQGLSQVAATFGVPIGTLKSWQHRQSSSGGVAVVASDKKMRIGVLLLEYLETSLETLKAQHKVFADAEWLARQSASEVAVLHGVIADKTIRLLEGLADAGEASDDQPA
jgi:transposase-like protein